MIWLLALVALSAPPDWLQRLRGPTAAATAPAAAAPTVTVALAAAGWPPAQIEAELVQPVERAVAGLPGVAQVSSRAGAGEGTVSVRFEWTVPVAVARAQVADAVQAVALPPGAEVPRLAPTEARVWQRAAVPGTTGQARAKANALADGLRRFAGVVAVTGCGLQAPGWRVQLDPARLPPQAPDAAAVARTLRGGPGGADLELEAALDLMLSPTVRLRDVAEISREPPTCRCLAEGKPATCLTVWGRGAPPLRLNEALGDALRVAPGPRTRVRVDLADPAVAQPALDALRGAPGGLWAEARDQRLDLWVAPPAEAEVLQRLAQVPGARSGPAERPGEPPVRVWITGDPTGHPLAVTRLSPALAATPGVRAVHRFGAPAPPTLSATLSPAGERLGLTAAALAAQVRAAVVGLPGGRWRGAPVRVTVPADPLTALRIALPRGAVAPLSAVAAVRTAAAPEARARRGGQPATALWVFGATPAAVRQAVEQAHLPAGVAVQVDTPPDDAPPP